MKPIYTTLLFIALLLCNAETIVAQQEYATIRTGNKHYNKQDYTEAEINYRRAIEKNANSFEGHYNLGDALFKQEKYPEATEEFQKAAQLVEKDNKKQKSETYHNLGNSLFAQQQYDKAVAAYQEALRNNPKDDDTRYNLVKAMQMLQQQQQQQQKKQEENNQQQQQQEDNQKSEQEQQEQQEQTKQNEQNMDKETAEQILQALEQDEQETQEKLQRQQGQKRRVEKDW